MPNSSAAMCRKATWRDCSIDDRHRFASYLVNQVTLVIVTTDDLAGAHRIFDVMNMRGVPLTASDVFKAKVVAAMSPAARNVYAARWDDIMDPIGDDAQVLEEFFSDLHLVVSHKPMCTQLLEEFRKDVLSPYINEQHVISFIDELLAPYAMAWRVIDQPTARCRMMWSGSSYCSTTTLPAIGKPLPCGRWCIPLAIWATPMSRSSPVRLPVAKRKTSRRTASRYACMMAHV